MAAKRPAATVLDASDNAQAQELPPPAKKPRGRPRGSVTKKKSAAIVADDDIGAPEAAVAEPAPPAAMKISYTLDIYSISQMKKTTKSRGDPKRSVMVLNSDEPWDTFKAQTLSRVEKVLKPPTISFHDYKVTFMVPRLQKTTDLEDEQSYEFMIGRATRSADPTAVISIEPLIPDELSNSDSDKENKDKNSDTNSSESGSEDGRKRKNKKKKRKEKAKSKSKKADPSDLPGNKAIALKIGELRQTWACNTPSCEHTHCWVNPERGHHIPLSHMLLNRWARAILKNDGSASIHKPPNHLAFDNVPENLKGEPSSLVERRKAAQKHAAVNSVPVPVQIFNGFPPEALQALNLPIQGASVTPITPAMASSSSSNATSSVFNSPLLPKSAQPQSPLLHSDFCTMYALSNDILSRFADNGFGTLTQLSYTTLQDLKDMEFKRGDIAAIQCAIAEWVQNING